MSGNGGAPNSIDFLVDRDHLYREETITDLKIATIRQLIPIQADGSPDENRETIFVGSTQLGTPQGPIPIQVRLEADSFDQAMDVFPRAMEAETRKVIDNLRQMHEQQKKASESRIIMPGVQ
jgi:hypothetical protein